MERIFYPRSIVIIGLNPLRLFKDGSGVCALDARMVIEKG